MREALENTTKYLLGDLGCERTGELEKYLAVVARFPTWSLYNHLLIFAQCPQAQVLATYEDWNTWGYSIQAKAKSRKLWDGKRFATYFDETQVWPREGAQTHLFVVEKEPPDQVLARLKQTLLEEGIDWRDYVDEKMGRDGAFHRLIAGCASRIEFHPFAQAHPGRIADGHVEAVTAIVARYFGFAPMPLHSDMSRWGSSPRELREELEVIRQTAGALIALLEAASGRRRPAPYLERQQHYRLALQ